MEVRRRLLLGLLSVLGIAVQASDVSSQNQLPPFCHNYDCPKYWLVKQYADFELRRYEETQWVTTSLKQDAFNIGMVTSFSRLFRYINGKNAEGLKMNMTVPVMVYMPLKQPLAGSATMSFFVSHEVKKPPTPTDPEVYLDTYPAVSLYVKTFGGYASTAMYVEQAKALAQNLAALGLQFDYTYFVRAGYYSPLDFFGRHNEVWYMAKSPQQWEFLDLSAAQPWL
ncbi:heme-binding protein 2-like [Bufo gargarizans]|uniref:heme-binding protein 2-like n=1 Tax=Bufo gargarizans TaxID=30331 RepID=UPI001CF51FD9|nr:heme-binding protein 2-like [Bufo gargarizans]